MLGTPGGNPEDGQSKKLWVVTGSEQMSHDQTYQIRGMLNVNVVAEAKTAYKVRRNVRTQTDLLANQLVQTLNGK